MDSSTLEMLLAGAGYLGVALYLGSYIGLQLRLIPGVGYAYATLNLVAAVLVLLSLIHAFNMASALIQASWVVISLVGITRTYLIARSLSFNDEEERFRAGTMPHVPREVARRFLDAGNWLDIEPSVTLTREHEPVTHLFYLASGRADVFVMERKVAEITEGFVGELHVLSDDSASATVQVQERARAFCVSRENLRRLCARDAQTGLYIEQLRAVSTRQKLMAANQALAGSDESS